MCSAPLALEFAHMAVRVLSLIAIFVRILTWALVRVVQISVRMAQFPSERWMTTSGVETMTTRFVALGFRHRSFYTDHPREVKTVRKKMAGFQGVASCTQTTDMFYIELSVNGNTILFPRFMAKNTHLGRPSFYSRTGTIQ